MSGTVFKERNTCVNNVVYTNHCESQKTQGFQNLLSYKLF